MATIRYTDINGKVFTTNVEWNKLSTFIEENAIAYDIIW